MAINVAHITLSMEMGGIERLIADMIDLFDKNRFSITVGCLDSGGRLFQEIQNAGIHSFVTGRRPGLDLGLIIKLARVFAKMRVDIVHAHNQAALFYSGLAAKLARTPVVLVTEHSRHNSDKYRRRRIEKRMLSRITDKWVTVSEELARLAVSMDRLPHHKIKVIRNGIDVSRFGKSNVANIGLFKEDLGIPRASKIVITVSRLDPIKNHPLLLDAIATVRRCIPDVHLVVVGDGECRASLEYQTLKLNLQDHVHFLGIRNDIPYLLKMSNVFVLCSLTEGLPLSLLEACAAKIPVVITDTANRADFIKANETGIVTQARVEDLAKGIMIALREEGLCKEMALRARKRVIKKYSLDAMVRDYEKLYLELITKTKVSEREK